PRRSPPLPYPPLFRSPAAQQLLTLGAIGARRERVRLLVSGRERVRVPPHAARDAGEAGSTERRRLDHLRATHRDTQDVRLELYEIGRASRRGSGERAA